MREIQIGRIYRHFKGNFYLAEAVAKDADSGEDCVIYRKLLVSGRYNVGESAEHSGFSNLSFFAKTYKKYMGELPSQAERKPKK